MQHIKFPSIDQYNHTVKNLTKHFHYVGTDPEGTPIYDTFKELPTITFVGTTKLHGTNGAFCYNQITNDWWCQSRERILSMGSDNAGFHFFCTVKREIFIRLANKLIRHYNINDSIITLFGEWAGPGIQKGVGISQIPVKSFFIFDAKVTPLDTSIDPYWLDIAFDEYVPHGTATAITSPANDIWNIYDFPFHVVHIDLSKPQEAVNDLISLTTAVEEECPVAKDFGISGIGEGLVYRAVINNTIHRFKVKGEKHSVSKVKTVASVDTEKLSSIQDFADYAVTENRLNQGIEVVFTQNALEPSIQSTGTFIKWIMSDIMKEELETLIASNIEPKETYGAISKKASTWFKNYLITNL